MRPLLLTVLMGLTVITTHAQPGPVGNWLGALNAGGATLRIVFHIEAAKEGGYSASLDSPDQGAFGIPVNQTTYEAGNTRGKTMILPGLNHLFQTSTTGAPAEYSQIAETMAPAALDAISTWIHETVGR